MKQNKTWCLRQPNLDSKLMRFWEAIDLSRRMLRERPACLLLWQKMCTCAFERPIEHLKHLVRAPVTHRIHSCVFTSSPYFSQYQKMPLWCNWSKGLWCHIHTFLKAKNVFFSQRTTGILHIWLYHTIWGKVLLNRRTNVFAFFLWQRGLPKTRRSWLQHNELTVSSLCHFPFVPN